ncbi:calcium-binding protein [Pararhizobium arenae]|uniref:calcium-binding protein n=1 Tax=Pararhizobium arenae TaxID=1856850 RepID=UPI00094AD032|nr:hypothetical protein [Pararhizobium arenae]
MATITVNSAYALDIRDIDFSAIYEASSYAYSSSLFRANYGGGSDEFRGNGFKYNSSGEPVAGTVKSYAATVGGVRAFIVEGISIAATDIVKAARTYSKTDDFALISKALAGKDTVSGGKGTDFVYTYGGNDTLGGNGGQDALIAGSGDDKLTGGAGGDFLNGEAGRDTFIYKSVKDSYGSSQSTRDTIWGFSGSKGDRFDLSAIDANSKTATNNAFSFIGSKAFTEKAGELRYVKKADDTYIYGDVNGDGKADFSIHLDDAITLQKGYFVL